MPRASVGDSAPRKPRRRKEVSVKLLALAAIVALVAACEAPVESVPPVDPADHARAFVIDYLGRPILCVAYDPPGDGGSITCDWSTER